MHTHIIYYAVYNGIVVYIGSGLPARYKHVISGSSHVYGLNKLHFLEPRAVSVHILKGFTNQEEALEEEEKLIKEFKPQFNTDWLEAVKYSLPVSSIEQYKGVFIPIVSELRTRVLVTPYAAIEQGLEPSIKNAVKYYEDPETDNEVLFKSFPLFAEWLNSGLTVSMMRTNGFSKTLISEAATMSRTLLCNTNEVKAQLNLEVGSVYTREELLAKVLEIYKSLNMEVAKPKATDIKKWYNIKSNPKRVKGELVTAYKILEEL